MGYITKIISAVCYISSCQNCLSVEQVALNFSQLTQQYDGNQKLPTVSSNPSGVDVALTITPRTSETVYTTTPSPLYGSYPSAPLQGSTNKALGDRILLGGSNRFLESIDVILVNWAKASDWPTLAAHNPQGYQHTISLIAYKKSSTGSFIKLPDNSLNVLVPWRPEFLVDGSPYPFGGISFKVRFNYPGTDEITDELAVLVGYNTKSAGFVPTGISHPSDSLNIALGSNIPTVGIDPSPSSMLRLENNLISTGTFGSVAPLFTVRAFTPSPPSGSPVNSGVYRMEARVTSPGFEGSASANLEILPVEVPILLNNLKQVADGQPKNPSVVTDPAGIPFKISYGPGASPPTGIGSYPVFVEVLDANRTGRTSGTLRLGTSFSSWISAWPLLAAMVPPRTGFSDDPDSDGVSNLLEYAAGTDPTLPDFSPLLDIQRENGNVALTYKENSNAIDLEYRIFAGSSLENVGSWAVLASPAAAISQLGAVRTMKVSDTLDTVGGKKFFRLRVRKTE